MSEPRALTGAADADVRALRKRVRRQTVLAPAAANLIGACVVAIYLVALSPGTLPGDFRLGEAALLFGVLLAVLIPLGDRLSLHFTRDAPRLLASGKTLDEHERRALIAVPWRAAVITFCLWAVGAAVVAAYQAIRLDGAFDETAATALTILLGGLTTSALVFLLNEYPLRAVYELAFRGSPPTRAEGVGVRRRLTLSWTLGAAVPLLAIALAFVPVDSGDFVTVRRAIVALVAIGLVAGLLITLRASRSVAEPLQGLRGALDRVRGGDLGVEVAVNDATEIGLLQAGFNEMVSGLRERAELEELFGRHVGVEVAQAALRRGARLGGERRDVSALFVDVAGSTKLAAERPPEEIVDMLNALFRAVVRTTTAEGGWINKFAGDAALCVFGALVDQPDHAARALRAARSLRAELSALAVGHPALDAGIGVSSGEVVAGNVGAEERYEYTVIGDPVNEAARLTEKAKSRDARVLAGRAAVERAGAEAEHWREAGVLELRGRPEPTPVYEPAGARSPEAREPLNARQRAPG